MSCEQYNLEELLFSIVEDPTYNHLNISDIDVIEIDETVAINFDTQSHLLAKFNALQGMNDLDWNTIELMKREEGIELNLTHRYIYLKILIF